MRFFVFLLFFSSLSTLSDVYLSVPAVGIERYSTSFEFATVGDLSLSSFERHSIDYSLDGDYIWMINGMAAEGDEGWCYRVNGEIPEVGAFSYYLSDGDSVEWFWCNIGDL